MSVLKAFRIVRLSVCWRPPTSIPALPFCRVTLTGRWKPSGYPSVLNNLGDHLRKRRLDLGRHQSDVAHELGVHEATVANWELGHTEPAICHLPKIIAFLGYDPLPAPASSAERLMHYRTGKGMSQAALACLLQVDASILRSWETGRRQPTGEHQRKIAALLSDLNRL